MKLPEDEKAYLHALADELAATDEEIAAALANPDPARQVGGDGGNLELWDPEGATAPGGEPAAPSPTADPPPAPAASDPSADAAAP